jgi:hypothetical protein
MRRTTSLLLIAALTLGPSLARADDEDEQDAAAEKKAEEEKAERAEKRKARKLAKEAKEKEEAKEEEGEVEDEDEAKPIEVPAFLTTFPPRRATYIIGGAFLVGGLAFAFSAQGEAKRSETITSAVEAQNALVNARASAATASVMYGLAAATLAYALMLEFLPEQVAEKASLTFHF